MLLPKANKYKTSNVELGTAYELNKNLIKKYEHELTLEELASKKELVNEFTQIQKNHYYMLLCHDRRDYTIFHTDNTNNSVYKDLEECLINRGVIYGIDKTKDEGAIEIWIMIEEEVYCYYFFPYESAVIEY